VSKEDLIISKLWWAKDSHSEIQLSDVKNLLATGYDAAYLERWTGALGYKKCSMTDTAQQIKELVHDKIMARSAAERFLMGAEMFDSALAMVKASLPTNLSRSEYKRKLFKRIYGLELPPGFKVARN
jgi:hypothetical protein